MTIGSRQTTHVLPAVRLLIAAALLSAPPARAAHPLITEDAYTLGAGVAQMEVGFEYARFDQSDVQGRVNNLRPVLSFTVRARTSTCSSARLIWIPASCPSMGLSVRVVWPTSRWK
jgi:hypothetical protein